MRCFGKRKRFFFWCQPHVSTLIDHKYGPIMKCILLSLYYNLKYCSGLISFHLASFAITQISITADSWVNKDQHSCVSQDILVILSSYKCRTLTQSETAKYQWSWWTSLSQCFMTLEVGSVVNFTLSLEFDSKFCVGKCSVYARSTLWRYMIVGNVINEGLFTISNSCFLHNLTSDLCENEALFSMERER